MKDDLATDPAVQAVLKKFERAIHKFVKSKFSSVKKQEELVKARSETVEFCKVKLAHMKSMKQIQDYSVYYDQANGTIDARILPKDYLREVSTEISLTFMGRI